jgi:acetyl esterase/lipase
MNPNPSSWTMRALVVAMQDWITEDRTPPASSYPRIDEGTLVPLDTVKKKFPAIPEIELPRDIHRAYRMNYGPRWETDGVITRHPPQVGKPFTVLVPDVDGDGNDRGGIRIPQIEVPLATYTPWNLRDPSIGAPTERISFLGSYFPFPVDVEQREESGDPRRSIAERYDSFDDYRSRYTEAAMQLIVRGFLLPADLERVIKRGRAEWHYATHGIDSPRIMQPDELTRLEQTRPEMRFAYGESPFRFGELRLPEGTGPFPVAVLIHGGCWLAAYDAKHIGALAGALEREGIASWTLEYNRVGDPGGGWPGTFRDVADGTDYLRVLARNYPLDLERVISIGHSAGGHLALWLAARARVPEGSPLYDEDPLPLRGVLGLAAAADLPYLHEQEVCGHVIDRLMGGSPDAFADRYQAGAPTLLVPLDVPQILINGGRDPFWSSIALRYLDAARAAGADVVLTEAPESGHFEMLDPQSTTWPLVREAVLQLINDSAD